VTDSPTLHVAQINIGTMVAPTDDPRVAEFMDGLDRINVLADSAAGFVWRLQTGDGNATSIQIFPDPLTLVNMSVWESVDALKAYVYQSDHVGFFRRRAEWFESDAKRVALWWIERGSVPELDDAVRRVEFLERRGPSPYAFGFGRAPAQLVVEPTRLDDPDTWDLVLRLNAELEAMAAEPDENHFALEHDDVVGERGTMVRAHLDGRLVGCGAVRRIEPTVGEVKRMFVDGPARGNKVGAAILDQLQLRAKRLGMTELKLETGPRQTEALGLYTTAGFERCDLFGEYVHTPATSMCFRKHL
jgi:GNAT superfamily N-acetyltransferase